MGCKTQELCDLASFLVMQKTNTCLGSYAGLSCIKYSSASSHGIHLHTTSNHMEHAYVMLHMYHKGRAVGANSLSGGVKNSWSKCSTNCARKLEYLLTVNSVYLVGHALHQNDKV